MRCLTLADALRNQGANCYFLCRKQLGDLNFLIEKRGYVVKELAYSTTVTDIKYNLSIIEEDIKQTIAAIGDIKANWLIVDHYSLDADWECIMRKFFHRIMVIDDLANRLHDCDILLDQNLREDSLKRYQPLVPGHCQILTGPNHVLLGSQYNLKSLRQRDGNIRRVLIYMGGNDITNQAGKALEALQLIPTILAVVVLGYSHPHRDAVFAIAKSEKRFQVMDICQDMANQMNLADLAVGTCGIAAWERCAMGLPALVAISAENQREDALMLHQLGAVEKLGDAENLQTTDWLHAIQRHISMPEKVKKMGEIAQTIVTGHEANFLQLLCQLNSSHAK